MSYFDDNERRIVNGPQPARPPRLKVPAGKQSEWEKRARAMREIIEKEKINEI